MNIFGIGTMEMAVIVIIALIVFGPGRLPEIMGEAGRMLRELRRQTRDLTGDFEESVREVRTTMTDVQGEMRSTMDEIRRETSSISSSVSESVNDVTTGQGNRSIVRPATATPDTGGVDKVVSVSVEPDPGKSAPAVPQPAGPAASKDDPLGDLAGFDDDLLDPKRS